MDRYFVTGIFAALLCFFPAQAAEFHLGDPTKAPKIRAPSHLLNGGERASYRATWNGIPIASANIRATPQMIGSKKFYTVKIEAQTARYLDLIWKMRDSVESRFDADTFQPHRFVFVQRENKRKSDTSALFDPGKQKWTVRQKRGDKVKEFEFVSARTFDPVSATYLARSLDFDVGDKIEMEVFGGKSRYRVTLDVMAKEPVSTKMGEFQAYRIIPRVANLNAEGHADKMREATVWISADDKRYPLKITSQVFIGSVSIEMVEEIS